MSFLVLKTAIAADSSPGFTTTLVIAGFFGVLLMLAILIVVISIFSKTVSKTQSKKGKRKEEKAIMTEDLKVVSPFNDSIAHAPAAATQGVSEEIVAAISAAVYMMEGEGAVIRSIAPAKAIRPNPIKTRNPWAMAAIMQNTKPF